jgi:hypothetical protein
MATSDEAVKEKAQFYRSTKLLTLYEGTVRGEGGKGSFLHYEENLAKSVALNGGSWSSEASNEMLL